MLITYFSWRNEKYYSEHPSYKVAKKEASELDGNLTVFSVIMFFCFIFFNNVQ